MSRTAPITPLEPISRLIAVVTEPLSLADLGHLAEQVEAEHGPGTRFVAGRRGLYEIRTAGRDCWCITCETDDNETFTRLTGRWAFGVMVVCPDCGNKRCPRATHHALDCSGSNVPGQAGSVHA